MQDINTRDPQFVAFWAKCLREASHWSQEALAEASGLDVRTIQRIESGKAVNVTTRRALARGLGYTNPDIFDDLEFKRGVDAMFGSLRDAQEAELKRQYPDHVKIAVRRATNGAELASIAYNANGYLFHADEGIAADAASICGNIFDYLRDLGDAHEDISFSDKLKFEAELDGMVQDLNGLGCTCYIACRDTKIVGEKWPDKTPISFTIGYLTVVPARKEMTEMLVPRRVS